MRSHALQKLERHNGAWHGRTIARPRNLRAPRPCAALLLTSLAAFAQTDFTRDVRPILQKKCIACHGPAQQMNGLRLDDGESALRGGYSGAAIVPGKSADSRLVARISSDKEGVRMPPAGDRLTAAEIAALRRWIDEGARWPASAKPVAATRKNSHWSFQPVVRPAPPGVKNREWIRNPIDAFVLARLEKEGLAPSPEAPSATLVRRASLDITGLPPSPQDIESYLADRRPGAWERLVDRLLASPHYGEKWARHWLDLAHYADSDGYEKDLARPDAWRWRHWVIDALNRDLPYDRFTIEQIAGDLLPGATADQRTATGFFRNTLKNREAGTDRREARFEELVNRVNTLATTWLGLTAGCAQCHDHKYDPITQRDYYQLFAFFHSAEEQTIEAPLPGEVGPYLRALPEYRQRRAKLLADYDIAALQAEWEDLLRAAIREPGRSPEWDFQLTSMQAMFDGAVRVLLKDPARRTPPERDRLTDYFVERPGPNLNRNQARLARLKELRAKLLDLAQATPGISQAMVIEHDEEAAPAHIHIKGDWRQHGIPVEAATPGFLPDAGAKSDRMALARWIVSPGNPLTARVAVNRVWQELFGRGLVRTADDFGAQGEKPSHPELLDWLAAEFAGGGWSMKELIRTIVTSSAYRQSSDIRRDTETSDPENVLLARQARLRLPAELVRDSALAVSGLLSTSIGGRSIQPPLPQGVAELGYAQSVKWNETEGRDRYRRGLYIHFQRTTPYPMLMTFDAPESQVSCARRPRSNTPLQSLNLLNDSVFFEAAQALAWRIERECPGAAGDRIACAWRMTLARAPADSERERMAKYLDEQSQISRRESGDAIAAWTGVARVLLNLDEFITRE